MNTKLHMPIISLQFQFLPINIGGLKLYDCPTYSVINSHGLFFSSFSKNVINEADVSVLPLTLSQEDIRFGVYWKISWFHILMRVLTMFQIN